MPHQLAVAIARVGFGERDPAADAYGAATYLQLARAEPHRFEEADLDLDRRIADAGGQSRLNGAAGSGVEQRAE